MDNRAGFWKEVVAALEIPFRAEPETVAVRAGGDTPIRAVHSFWFAWHAMHPDDELVLQ